MDICKEEAIYSDSLIIGKKEEGMLYENNIKEKLNIRSLAKTVLALACGILIDKSRGDFNENTYVLDLIRDKIKIRNKSNIKYLKKIRIKDLLSHTIGYRDILLMSKDIEDDDDLLDFLINYPIHYEPGEYFLYSNAGYYLLSVCMQEYLAYDLMDFIADNLFKKLSIDMPKWDRFGPYIFGASRLYLSAEDLYKIGAVLLNDGSFEGESVVSSSWTYKMKSSFYNYRNDEKDRGFLSKKSYGYGIWTSTRDIKFATGTGGQYIILLENEGIIIVTLNSANFNKSVELKSRIDDLIYKIKGDKNGL